MRTFSSPFATRAEHVARAPRAAPPGSARVVRQGGAGQEEGAAAVQPLRIERGHLAADAPNSDHHAARPQRGQASVEGGLAHPVEDDVAPRPPLTWRATSGELVVVVRIGACCLASRALAVLDVVATRCRRRPLNHLGEQQTDAAPPPLSTRPGPA